MSQGEIEKTYYQNKIFGTKKAFCFMFSNQYYQLHLETINLLYNVVKDNCLQLIDLLMGKELQR